MEHNLQKISDNVDIQPERLTFIELLKPELFEKDLDFNKAVRWFEQSPFILDKLFLSKCDPEISRIFYEELFDLNSSCISIKNRLEKIQYPKETKEILLKCLSFLYRKTLFGMTKYCLETRTYQCEMKKDYGIYRMSWFHFVIMNVLDDCVHKWLRGESGSILALSVPPQHCKSTIVSGSLPALLLANKQDAEGLIVCYNEKYAESVLKKNLYKVIKSAGYKNLFSKNSPMFTCHMDKETKYAYKLDGSKLPLDNKDTLETTMGGRVFACSAKQATGNPGNFICLDDPVPSQEAANSTDELEKINKEIESSVETRMRSRSLMCIAQTRWHTLDPIGTILKKDEDLRSNGEKGLSIVNLCFRAEYDPTDNFEFDFRKYKGQLLWEEVCGSAYNLRKIGDPRAYAALYQQRPLNDFGSVFQKKWINEYLPHELPDEFMRLAVSIDTSYNDKNTSDRCAIGVFGLTKQLNYYLLHLVYDRMTFMETVEHTINVIKQYPNYTEILVEPKANGQALLETLREQFQRVPDIESPTESKLARAMSISPIIQSRKFYVPKSIMGQDFMEQLLDFKGQGKHEKDDLVDITVQTMRYYDEIFKREFSPSDISVIKSPSTSTRTGEFNISNNPFVLKANRNYKSVMEKWGSQSILSRLSNRNGRRL